MDTFPDTASKYDRYSEDLSILDVVPMFGRWVIILAFLRESMLDSLNDGLGQIFNILDRDNRWRLEDKEEFFIL